MSRALATAFACACLAMMVGCTTSDVLEPSAMDGSSQPAALPAPSPVIDAPVAPAEALGQPAQPGAIPASNNVAMIPAAMRLGFAPVVGGTADAVTPLTQQLVSRARERGIGLVASGDPSATHVLKGYLSAVSDSRSTTVIYVWDVLGPGGNRVHRIQGQVKAEGRSGEGWAAVSPDAMRSVGNATIDALAAWAGGQQS
ncbi:MAG: hypothetical protein AB7S80_00200 [Rhizobiaceae bacterium]